MAGRSGDRYARLGQFGEEAMAMLGVAPEAVRPYDPYAGAGARERYLRW